MRRLLLFVLFVTVLQPAARGGAPADARLVRIDAVATDSRGRVHGLEWLRVADSSLFPNSVEINPYLTVMALADRVAEGVLELAI